MLSCHQQNPQIAQIVAGRPGDDRVAQPREKIVGVAAAQKSSGSSPTAAARASVSPSATAPAAGLLPSIPSVPALNHRIGFPAIFGTHARTNAELRPPIPLPVTGLLTSPSASNRNRPAGIRSLLRLQQRNQMVAGFLRSANRRRRVAKADVSFRFASMVRGVQQVRARPGFQRNARAQTPDRSVWAFRRAAFRLECGANRRRKLSRSRYFARDSLRVTNRRRIGQRRAGRQRGFFAGRHIADGKR